MHIGQSFIAQACLSVVELSRLLLLEDLLRIVVVDRLLSRLALLRLAISCELNVIAALDQELEVVLFTHPVVLDPIHALVRLLRPCAEVENDITLVDVPELDADCKVDGE